MAHLVELNPSIQFEDLVNIIINAERELNLGKKNISELLCLMQQLCLMKSSLCAIW